MTTIDLTGWTHVHTYRESHGSFTTETYQQEPLRAFGPLATSLLLEVTTHHNDKRPTGLSVEPVKFRDFLTARHIAANPEDYLRIGDRHVSPCCTAGHDDYQAIATGKFWRVISVAGHGEWACPLTEEEATDAMPITLAIEDEPTVNTTLGAFLADNADGFDPCEANTIRRDVAAGDVHVGCVANGFAFAIHQGHNAAR